MCEFLLNIYNNGATSSSLNSIRSGLSFFLTYELNLKDDVTISRLFKFFYKKRPLQPKYFTYWPVKDLLSHLSSLHPSPDLSLKELTLKTLALIALSSSDRGQTIEKININNVTITENKVTFVIFDRLKHTRKVNKPKVIECLSSDNAALDVCDYVKAYMQRTAPLREKLVNESHPKSSQLFISWLTKRPVTRQTLARWLKTSLSQAGIDSGQFSAHSYRGAGLSAAYNKGANINQIIEAGSWTNVGTFKKHYLAPENTSNVGRIILQQMARL